MDEVTENVFKILLDVESNVREKSPELEKAQNTLDSMRGMLDGVTTTGDLRTIAHGFHKTLKEAVRDLGVGSTIPDFRMKELDAFVTEAKDRLAC